MPISVWSRMAQWAASRGIIKGSTVDKQLLKLTEELGEVVEAHNKGKPIEEFHKELGDMLQVITNLAEMTHAHPELCAEMAYNKIKDRDGLMIDGQFVKAVDVAIGINRGDFSIKPSSDCLLVIEGHDVTYTRYVTWCKLVNLKPKHFKVVG